MKKKVIIMIGVLWVCLCLAFVLISFKYEIKKIFNNIFSPTEITSLNLTEEEKLEDFNFFFDTVTSSIPMIDEYSSIYGFNFKEKKEYYEELVKATTTDYEFYCVMSALSQEIPSFHTDLVYPDSINSLHCYNSKQVSSERDVVAYNRYWTDLIEKESANKYNYCVFTYIDGKYLFNSAESTVDNELETAQLIEIDGKNIDEYITEKVYVYNLYYDGANSKPCRTKLVFNTFDGEKVKLKLKLSDGSFITKEFYYSLYSETTYLYTGTSEQEYKDYVIYETDNYTYIAINNMSNPYGDEIKKQLGKVKNRNVIIDLRENYGGNTEYAAKYIYPMLYSEDIEESNYWFMPNSKANQSINSDWANKILLNFNETEEHPYKTEKGIKMLCSEVKQSYKGEVKENKNVLILTSQKTGSAADRFASDMQKNGLAKIVGNNTGGEGLMYSYSAMYLPNSHLVFIYMPGGAKNPDESDNSVCGTKADIYINFSESDFYIYNEMIKNESDLSSFEAKLNYDTVLKYCVDYLGE